jgi:hypothetical protein
VESIGGHGGAFTVVGPRDPSRMVHPIADNLIWALARVLWTAPAIWTPFTRSRRDQVEGKPAQTSACLQARCGVAGIFSSASRLLMENPPPATDRRLHRIAPLGLAGASTRR